MTLDYNKTTNREEINYKEFVSWNTISYFKTMGGIMIRPILSKQKLLISLIKKTGEKKYQSFKDGIVIKFNAQQIDELFFYLENDLPYSTWRRKQDGAYNIWISYIKLENYQVPNSKTVLHNQKSLKIKISNSKKSEQQREFIFSPFEYKFVLDIFKEFRNQVVKRFVMKNESNGYNLDFDPET